MRTSEPRGRVRRVLVFDTANRIIEIEWAVKHGKPFEPSPKKPKKLKTKRSKEKGKNKAKGKERVAGPSSTHVPEVAGDRAPSPSKQSPRKGRVHSTTTATDGRPRSPKRHADEMLEGSTGADDIATPPRAKRGRTSLQQDAQPEPEVGQDSDWEQWEPPRLQRLDRKRPSLSG